MVINMVFPIMVRYHDKETILCTVDPYRGNLN